MIVGKKSKYAGPHDQYTIIGIEWRSGLHTVGAVAIKTNIGWKAYIGAGGVINDDMDAHMIAANGAKLKKAEAIAFFPDLDPKKCENE